MILFTSKQYFSRSSSSLNVTAVVPRHLGMALVLATPLPGLPSNTTSAPPGDPAPLIWPRPFDSPLPLDASEGGLFAGGFVPPPPRPTFIDESATPDGPTTCDLCSWAWQNTGGGTGSGGGGYGVFDAAVEVPGEIGWVLTLVIVSLTSAIIGAIVMIVVLHCKRIKTSSESDPDHGGVSLEQMAAGRQRLPIPGGQQEDKEIVSSAISVLTAFPSGGSHHRSSSPAAHYPSAHHHHQNATNGVWSWLARRSSGCQQHHQQFSSPTTLPVENHYTHMEDGYNSVSGRAPSTVPAGDEDALYAELDRSASPSPSDASPAYQNSAYADPDAPPSAPSSAYYSDLSTHTAGAVAMPPPPLPPLQQSNERAYEVVGLATLHPACWGDSGRGKLEAISEHGTVPSDYV
ncbi:unnamed protein product [Acanthoscelides obtectus]|uniref:Uncharacterized protein n=1 Tax=Acanthoscelides obtectus TaxID=200917 RepID=A0A9P0LSC9_ACAOB|nr:unnamed protein product [Acanthoscelides obtectus]CAK1638720.1 hypothetical protein AOBTE_LOCUS10777 [Acanthoscelides obtectus]